VSSPDPDVLLTCKNCEQPFNGKFCPQCGQSTKNFLRPFPQYISELVTSIFSADSRLWTSLKAQILQPGVFVRDYLNGKSVRFMPPVRLYLFSSFIFFLVLNQCTGKIFDFGDGPLIHVNEKTIATGDSIGSASNNSAEDNFSKGFSAGFQSEADSTYIRMKIESINANPGGFIQLSFRYLSWAMILLMPLMGFFLWVMFRKSQPFYAPHFLLALLNHSAAFLLFSVAISLDVLWSGSPVSFFMLSIPVVGFHLYRGVQQLNGTGTGKTLLRTAPALMAYSLSVSLTLLTVLLLSWSNFA